ncbi:uncharacterized protein YjbI with pentapeptide repeats [Antricoccus suffuscus]|uniref:Uncharacterized protein YjbI with pentapeptide repeats n=1 Tax=Antricoccus suffuscus TaxID=1629062 RepID=A0A2T0ZWV3_9ACTN|nr:pentapeptide repeat-containing protein [Antricoccus suffuscus]PRZ40764.1 uncharacterized protein YjbI with pentapeptide repeats [Antricoccus suffuscus]
MAQDAVTPPSLVADCGSCFGLCCVALRLDESADFPVDKPAGEPCHNLQEDFGCAIHARLRPTGWKGCTVFDCFGAGQQVSQVTFAGVSWRDAPEIEHSMYAALPVMRQLHEMLFYLHDARRVSPDGALAAAYDETVAHTADPPERLLALDVTALRARVSPLLRSASAAYRRTVRRRLSNVVPRKVHPGADLMAADLRGMDLRAADLRNAYLIGADLRRSDLRHVDLLGADLRDADLRGSDLRGAIFLTQPQLNAAAGDASTEISPALVRPSHWIERGEFAPGSAEI